MHALRPSGLSNALLTCDDPDDQLHLKLACGHMTPAFTPFDSLLAIILGQLKIGQRGCHVQSSPQKLSQANAWSSGLWISFRMQSVLLQELTVEPGCAETVSAPIAEKDTLPVGQAMAGKHGTRWMHAPSVNTWSVTLHHCIHTVQKHFNIQVDRLRCPLEANIWCGA